MTSRYAVSFQNHQFNTHECSMNKNKTHTITQTKWYNALMCRQQTVHSLTPIHNICYATVFATMLTHNPTPLWNLAPSNKCPARHEHITCRLRRREMVSRGDWKCETWICGTTLHGCKLREMKMRDQFAGVEYAGKVSMESQSVKKCLEVVVFVCRVIPSV